MSLSLISTGEKVTIKKQTEKSITLKFVARKKRMLPNGKMTLLTLQIAKKNACQILNGYDAPIF